MDIRKYPPIAMILVIMVAMTALSWPVDLHYCKGELKSMSFIGKAPSCHEVVKSCCSKGKQVAACSPSTTGECKKGCCNNEVQLIDIDVDFFPAIYSAIDMSVELYARVSDVYISKKDLVFERSPEICFKPPDLETDFQSFMQVWRL